MQYNTKGSKQTGIVCFSALNKADHSDGVSLSLTLDSEKNPPMVAVPDSGDLWSHSALASDVLFPRAWYDVVRQRGNTYV